MSEYKSDWFPGRVTNDYRKGFDRIHWNSEKQIARKGKTKESTSSRMLQIDDAIKFARTPINVRQEKDLKPII